MKRKLFLTRCIAILAILAVLFTGCGKQPAANNPSVPATNPNASVSPTVPTVSVVPEGRAVKNIIFMIADGGGYDNFTLAGKVKEAMLAKNISKLPGAKTQVTTNLLADIGTAEVKGLYLDSMLVGSANTLLQVPNGDAAKQKSYITDSAAAGTALSSGYKTAYSYLGITAEGAPRASLSELARMNGMSTGVVTNKSYVDATPLAFFTTHAIHRTDNINNSIQALMSNVDVMIAEGTEYGDLRGIDESTHPDISASKMGYTVARTKSQLLEKAATAKKLWAPILGVDNSLKELKTYEEDYNSDHISYDVDAAISAEQPALLDMTKAALQVFENIDNPEGFFLMIEGGALDNAAEGGHLSATVGEYLAFDEAFGYCVNWAAKRGDTIVIAVPDHDSGGFSGIEKCEKALIDGIIAGKIGDQELHSMLGFKGFKAALEGAGANAEGMAIVSGHTEMAVPISLFAPDSVREGLLTAMGLPTVKGDIRTGSQEYYVPNESSDLTWYASSALNKDYVIDNAKIASALATVAELGSLDEATSKLFQKVSSTDAENGKLIFPEESLYNGYGEYYAVTYETADKALSVGRNTSGYTLNGQKQEIPKIGNQRPLAIFVLAERNAQDEGTFYVPESVYTMMKK